MTFATTTTSSSSTVQHPGTAKTVKAASSRLSFPAWQVLPAMLVALIALLTLTPDGIAEPLQDFAGWLVVGGVATLAVMAIVTGLDRLLDCEGN